MCAHVCADVGKGLGVWVWVAVYAGVGVEVGWGLGLACVEREDLYKDSGFQKLVGPYACTI